MTGDNKFTPSKWHMNNFLECEKNQFFVILVLIPR